MQRIGEVSLAALGALNDPAMKPARFVLMSFRNPPFCQPEGPRCHRSRAWQKQVILNGPIQRNSCICSRLLLRLPFASRPGVMSQVLSIVYHVIAKHLIKKAEFIRKTARTSAVTLIQWFGLALKLNIHFYMLFLDAVYVDGSARFRWVKAPTVPNSRNWSTASAAISSDRNAGYSQDACGLPIDPFGKGCLYFQSLQIRYPLERLPRGRDLTNVVRSLSRKKIGGPAVGERDQ